MAAYACAVALEPTIRTSIAHTWFLQRDNKRVASIDEAVSGATVAVFSVVVASAFMVVNPFVRLVGA